MIRIDAAYLSAEPLDMRAGFDGVLARVIAVFGAAQPHHAYLFMNRRAGRLKVLVHDGFGLWLASRRLHRGHFHRLNADEQASLQVHTEALSALILGLPSAFKRKAQNTLKRFEPKTKN